MWQQFILIDIITTHDGVSISGYDWTNRAFIRPISTSGQIPLDFLKGAFPFTVLELDFVTNSPDGEHPHTENWRFELNSGIRVGRTLDMAGQMKLLETIAEEDTHALFGQNAYGRPLLQSYRNRYYLPPTIGNRSLGVIPARSVAVGVDNQQRLRISFTDAAKAIFNDIALASLPLKSQWNRTLEADGNLAAINQQLRQSNPVYVSLSLGEPWQPTGWNTQACILQVSGIHAYGETPGE
jgi:hypothetical protein